jgi:hypothetical protein
MRFTKAVRDPSVPVGAKIFIGLVAGYALSPLDLIPDFIPVLGYLDDLLILPTGIWLAIRLIPREVWMELQTVAAAWTPEMSRSGRAVVVIVIIWLLSAAVLVLWLLRAGSQPI